MPDSAPDSPDDLASRLAAYLSARWDKPVQVSHLERFHGGAARETFRFRAQSDDGDSWLVLRRDPAASLISTAREVEFHALARAHAAGLPVPRPRYLETGAEAFGAPGFLMDAIEGGRASGLFEEDPYGAARGATGTALVAALGRLHRLVPDAEDMKHLPFQDAGLRLAHWRLELERHELRPEPVAHAALRWLERHLPGPSGPPAFVHGDFRSGNFLVDANNQLLAILDWEMAHIGDPLEDLAWLADPLWAHGQPDLVGAMLPLPEVIRTWEAHSGRRFDASLFAWWRLFAGFQGLAIWITSGFEVARMQSVDPVLVFSALYPYRAHNASVARMLKELAA